MKTLNSICNVHYTNSVSSLDCVTLTVGTDVRSFGDDIE